MMSELIINHARRNIWCTPRQDKQLRIKLGRLTADFGVRAYVYLNNVPLTLPTSNEKWHVYQFGQIHFQLYDVNLHRQNWISLERMANRNNVLIELYTDTGKHFPLRDAYIIRTLDNNTLLAIRHNAMFTDPIPQSTLYFRTYSNAYYNSLRSLDNPRRVNTYTRVISNELDRVNTAILFQSLLSEPGHTYGYVNGYYVDVLNALSVAVGDYVEIVQDSSVKQVLHIPIAGLETFESTLDAKNKYLIRGGAIPGDTIEYEDDIDVFMSIPKNGYRQGVTYIKNAADAMRMLTHKDYAIPTDYVYTQVEANDIFTTAQNITLTLFIRHSGYHRPLVLESSRINELYKLEDEQITQAMVGAQATLEEWQAATLENAAYPAMMRNPYGNITTQQTDQVYGYYGVANVIGASPLDVVDTGGVRTVALPPGFDSGGTIYEYNLAGVLLGFYNHASGLVYVPVNPTCVFVEAFIGVGNDSLDQQVDVVTGSLTPSTQYRFYRCPKISGIPNNEYVDVTGTSDVALDDTQYQWNVSNTLNRLLVRRENRFLSYNLSVPVLDGLLRFTISSRENIDGQLVTEPVVVPTARLDLWLNGRPLVRYIDYFVQWPLVYIVNRSFINPTGNQNITVRAYGLTQDDLLPEEPVDYGFVEYDTLSRNQRFDIHDGKILRIVVGGYVKRRQDIKLSEDHPTLQVSSVFNGKPYCLWDQIVPITPYVDEDSYEMRMAALALDQKISDYITPRYSDPEADEPSGIFSRYQLVSPFLAKVVREVLNGSIEQEFVWSQPSTQEIVERLQVYEELLPFDPSQDVNHYDPNYMLIRAHPQTEYTQLDIFQWRFIEKVNQHYLFGRCDMTTNFSLIP